MYSLIYMPFKNLFFFFTFLMNPFLDILMHISSILRKFIGISSLPIFPSGAEYARCSASSQSTSLSPSH